VNEVIGLSDEFNTFRESMKKGKGRLSPSSEDYMEMIYRLTLEQGYARVSDLAHALHVQPPSVTKMLQKLSELNLIKYEKYGVIHLENDGYAIGKALLKRHQIIEAFLKLLQVSDGIIEETEKIEHTINETVLEGIHDLLDFFKEYPELYQKFYVYRSDKK
jgi:Mn-dependent DtxR family transcriptional regulator